MFELKFATDNAAFEEAFETEITVILDRVAEKVRAGHREGTVRDTNGNTVGSFQIS